MSSLLDVDMKYQAQAFSKTKKVGQTQMSSLIKLGIMILGKLQKPQPPARIFPKKIVNFS